MANIIAVPQIPGVDGLFALIAFLNDEKRFTDRLNELQAMGDRVNALIEKVGPAEQIETMLTNTVAALEAARNKLADANAEAETLRATAKAEVSALRSTFDAERAAWQAQKDEASAELADQSAVLMQRMADLKVAEESASRAAQDAAQTLAKARAMHEAAQTKLDRLKAAIGTS